MNGVESIGPSSAGLAAASQAAARVAELQTLIQTVETDGKSGKGSFGAALAEATAVEGGATPALGESTALTPSTSSPCRRRLPSRPRRTRVPSKRAKKPARCRSPRRSKRPAPNTA